MTSLDLSHTPAIPLARLSAVEFRKAIDTRAGRWFIIALLALIVVVYVIFSFITATQGGRGFQTYVVIAGNVLGYFLPIIIIMMVTAEASQRNGLVTFTLEPRRAKGVAAKFIAGLALGLLVVLLTLALAVFGTLMGSITDTGAMNWSVQWGALLKGFLLLNLIGVLLGFALSMLLMNTPAAIVSYFAFTLVLPTVADVLSRLVPSTKKYIDWLELTTAEGHALNATSTTLTQWAQLGVAFGVWVIIPLVFGVWRLMRIEFK